jgi:hypothetical protein
MRGILTAMSHEAKQAEKEHISGICGFKTRIPFDDSFLEVTYCSQSSCRERWEIEALKTEAAAPARRFLAKAAAHLLATVRS